MEINQDSQETSPLPSSLEEWRRLMEEQGASGKSIKEFCRERCFSPAKYYYWRDRVLGKPPRSQWKARGKPSKGFAAVEFGKQLEGIQLEFPSGIIVKASPWSGSVSVIEILKELGGLKDA